jgi:hypothetical protein
VVEGSCDGGFCGFVVEGITTCIVVGDVVTLTKGTAEVPLEDPLGAAESDNVVGSALSVET